MIKYLKCAATPEEENAVRSWLADDPDGSHARQYADAHFLYEGMVVHSDSGHAAARRAGHVKSRTRKLWLNAGTELEYPAVFSRKSGTYGGQSFHRGAYR